MTFKMTSINPKDVKDLSASLVVLLIALPLCMGIALASGAPPARGILTGIIGGVVVGFFAGSPLQVSGLAAGLAVIVFEIIRDHGITATTIAQVLHLQMNYVQVPGSLVDVISSPALDSFSHPNHANFGPILSPASWSELRFRS